MRWYACVSARVREYECLCVSLRMRACACLRSACAFSVRPVPCQRPALIRRRYQCTGVVRLQVGVLAFGALGRYFLRPGRSRPRERARARWHGRSGRLFVGQFKAGMIDGNIVNTAASGSPKIFGTCAHRHATPSHAKPRPHAQPAPATSAPGLVNDWS